MKKAYLPIFFTIVLILMTGQPVKSISDFSRIPRTTNLSINQDSSLVNLTLEADLIIVGNVNEIKSYWNAEGTSIFSDISISPEFAIKGDASLQNVMVVVEGGQVGDMVQKVSESPTFHLNEEILLFLRQDICGAYSLLYGQKSVYVINEDMVGLDTSLYEFIVQIQQIMGVYGIPLPSYIDENQRAIASEFFNGINSEEPKPDGNSLASVPDISGVLPSTGSAGTNTQIIINGNNFGAVQGSGKVTFYYRSGEPRIEALVYFWDDTRIIASIPVDIINGYKASASSGQMIVSNEEGDSFPYPFDITFSYIDQKWSANSPEVHYRVNPNASEVSDEEIAVQAGAQTWNSVPDIDFGFVYDGPTSATGPAYNGVNDVMWGDLGAEGPLATASYWSDTANNMLEFDIEFNSNFQWSTTGDEEAYDIQTIVTHEFGHALGLRDLYGDVSTPNDMEKVMYGRRAAGEIRRDLSEDDIAGVRWLYTALSAVKTGDGGFGPAAIGVNESTNRIYVSNIRSTNITVLDGFTNQVVDLIDLGKVTQGIAVNPVTNLVYVSNSYSDDVTVIDGASNTVINKISVGSLPFRLGVDTSTNRIYVANNGSDNISVIDGASNSVIATVDVGDGPSGIGVNPTSSLIYVSNDLTNNVSVVDGVSNSVIATIDVGNGPGGIEVDPISNHIFVANYGSNSVSVIDGADNTVITEINVGSSPRGIAVNSDSNLVYVANYGSNNISVIDGLTNSVVSTIDVGSQPFGVAVNTTTNIIYVTNNKSNGISLIDGDDNSLLSTMSIGNGPEALGVNLADNIIYVTNSGSDIVSVIDRTSNTIIDTIQVGIGPAGIAVNPETDLVYVANSGSNDVSVINSINNTVVDTISVGSRPTGACVNTVTNRIYVTNNGGGSVSVIDGSDNTVIATVNVGLLPLGIDVNTVTNRIYVANNFSNTVSVIDGITNNVVATVSVGTWPFGIAVNATTNLVYVANNGDNSVSVIDGITNGVATTYYVGNSPRGVVVDNGNNRVYVANNGDGSVSKIDENRGIVVNTKNVGKGPRNVSVYPETNLIYVACYWADNVAIIQDESLQGDVKDDGVVNMGDVVELERMILGLDFLTLNADVNNDCMANMGDATKIERIILGFD